MIAPGDKESNEKKLKIAIIGSGISGTANAYFLKHLFGDKVEIVIFEKSNSIGGRLATYEFNERMYEIGGSVLHPSNKYMEEFLKILDLKKKDQEEKRKSIVGLFDSNGLLFNTTGNLFGLLDKIRFLRHFGFFQLLKFKKWIRMFIKNFSKIYRLQEHGFVFNTLEEFLTKLSPELYIISQKSLENALKDLEFNKRIIYELASIACLTNYCQSIEIDGFVGLVSLAGTIDDLWAVETGNKSVPTKLVEKAGAELRLKTKVKYISKDSQESNKNSIVYETENGDEIQDNTFDYVIIAFPIFKNVIGDDFKLNFDIQEDFNNLEMQVTNTYVVYGELILFPNLPSDKRISLHCIDPKLACRSIAVQLPCDYSKKKDKNLYLNDGKKLYKIFSQEKLDENAFERIFKSDYEIIQFIPWLAYPKYEKNPNSKQIPKVILDSDRSRILYSNSLEWSSSCMEMCAISARNVANIIAAKENVLTKKFFSPKKDDIFTSNLHLMSKISSFVLISGFLFSSFYKI
ncbi:unnamed protein product [Brachionus calyciflorus]|uniref:Prenylcysteine lyase domain-containing protein n=1 Tax=Brachionus calyciflorus TaxID=104777 RepID=A0A813RNR6_9BILA|nr:unnamed protein product [Brachionus calyciflorus]